MAKICSLDVSGQVIVEDELIGNWKLLKEAHDDRAANKIVNDAIAGGTYSDTLSFRMDKTYVRSNGAPYISRGDWSILRNSIVTANSRFEPAQTDAILTASYTFDNVVIRGDTLSFTAHSEWTGRSYYIRIK